MSNTKEVNTLSSFVILIFPPLTTGHHNKAMMMMTPSSEIPTYTIPNQTVVARAHKSNLQLHTSAAKEARHLISTFN
eukprot:scaffold3453_cov256-Chaetoceros_neogracile.AAC.36